MARVGKAKTKGARATKVAGGAGGGSGRSQQQFAEPELRDIGQRVEAAVSSVPIGAMFMWASGVMPEGYLECNGQSFSGDVYPVLLTLFPSGVLPDMRGRVPVGAGQGTGLTDRPNGTTFGAEANSQQITLTTNEMPSHTHTTDSLGAHDHSTRLQYVETTSATGSAPRLTGLQSGAGTFDYFTQTGGGHGHIMSSAGAGQPFSVNPSSMQPSLALKFIIKAG